jgi:uncharacterized alkaline shock family protein YloU
MNKIDKATQYGGINISLEAISKVVGEAVTSSYGVAGIVSKKYKDGDPILDKDHFKDGIRVTCDIKKTRYDVDIYVLIIYPSKVTEVIFEVQKKVRYVLEETFSIKFNSVNIYVVGLKA